MKLFQKIISASLVLMLLAAFIPAMAVNAESKQFAVSAMNSTRSEGTLIVYTEEFGDTTDTNAWGYEAVIDSNNVCISVSSVGNSTIPSGGFVVSGHNGSEESNKNADVVKNNIKVGDYVYFNKSAMLLTVSDEPLEFSEYYSVEANIDGTNTSRGTDMMILYNISGAYTLTNSWGTEVIVENGIVTVVGGNNSRVPTSENSFVISGHGTSSDWLKANVVVGMSAETDGDKVIFSYSPESRVIALKASVSELEEQYAEAIENCLLIDRDEAASALDSAKSAAQDAIDEWDTNGGTELFESLVSNANSLITAANKAMTESSNVEYRGVWLRPTQTTAEEVDAYVQKLYESGINLICIETLYNSCMIMPMPSSSLFEQNPDWAGFDMLQAFIDSCHARGMELHVWLPTFYVGRRGGTNYTKSVGYKKPEWLSITNEGNIIADYEEEEFYMLDPSNPEVKEFLLETYEYILRKYDIDGWELDYIRYREAGAEDYGYNDTLVNGFKEKYGITPTYDTSASWWDDWCDYRASFITDIVRSIRDLIDEVRPATLLCAAVGGSPSSAKSSFYQDYIAWIEEGLLDMVHPMCYGNGYQSTIEYLAELCGTRTMLCVGLGTYVSDLTDKDLLDQAINVNLAGGNGSAFFEATTYFSKKMPAALEGLYSNAAVTPTSDTAVSSKIAEISQRLDLMKADGKISESTAADILAAVTALDKADVTDSEIEALVAMLGNVEASSAKNMLSNDIYSFARILSASDLMDWSPEEYIPDPPSEDPEESSNAEESSEPEESSSDESRADVSDGGNNSTGIMIIIIVAAVIILAAAAFVIIKRVNKQK